MGVSCLKYFVKNSKIEKLYHYLFIFHSLELAHLDVYPVPNYLAYMDISR